MSDKVRENVVHIREAVASAKSVPKKSPPKETPKRGGGGGRGEIMGPPPRRLPPDSPAVALGTHGDEYFFLDSLGQFRRYTAEKLGRLVIISLFGGSEYLITHWPAFDKQGRPKPEFQHGLLAPVLMSSACDQGVFDPIQRVRGPGAWRGLDDRLILHCGDVLYMGDKRVGTGFRDAMLYPAAPSVREPRLGAPGWPKGPAQQLLGILKTWTFQREVDPLLLLGWIGAAMLGGAPAWRPMVWLTGSRGTGKSTLQKLIRWIFGPNGLVHSEDASRAGIYQRVGHSSLPVALDEFESKGDNRRSQEIIDLARIAASGGLVLRGGATGQNSEFTARNCFLFSSILIPSLRAADRSRMAFLELDKLKDGAGLSPDLADDAVGKWETCGQELRGRLIGQWPRYPETWTGYRGALEAAGHDARAADQFGALGAAYDLLMFDGWDPVRADEWAELLPAASMAETSGSDPDERSCVMHLAEAAPDVMRSGERRQIGEWIVQARRELDNPDLKDGEREACRILARLGIRLYRDALRWWVDISNTHSELGRVFATTQWSGVAGAPGAWAQALLRVTAPAEDGSITLNAAKCRVRINGQLHYVTRVPYGAFDMSDKAIKA